MELKSESLFGDHQEKQKNIITRAREVIEEYVFRRPSIDKLLREKVEDYIIIRELPLGIQIGEKKIFVGTFTLETQDIFFKEYIRLMGVVAARNANLDLGITFFSNGSELYKVINNDKRIRKGLYRLINETVLKKQNYIDPISGRMYNLPKVSLGYFKKNITVDGLMQICMLIYIYNFDATRRSLNLLMGEMGAQASTATYMWSWLKNLPGVSGKFLQSQLILSGLPLSVVQSEPPKPTNNQN